LDAGAIEPRGVEALDEGGRHRALLFAGTQSPAQGAEGVLHRSIAQRPERWKLFLHRLPQLIAGAEAGEILSSLHFAPVVATQRLERWRLAVDELRARLERHRPAGDSHRVYPAADAIARLEDQNAAPGKVQRARRREPRHAGADDEDVHGR